MLACFASFAFGGLFLPGDWYQSLNRAPWSPPNIAFPIVWLILYLLIAISGWLIFSESKQGHAAKTSQVIKLDALWIIQLVANSLWSWVFFGEHWVLVGLFDLLLIDALVITIILRAWKQSLKTVALLMTPYFIWLLLATSLNLYILVNN